MAELNDYQIIIKPIFTEKSVDAATEGKYTFEVDSHGGGSLWYEYSIARQRGLA